MRRLWLRGEESARPGPAFRILPPGSIRGCSFALWAADIAAVVAKEDVRGLPPTNAAVVVVVAVVVEDGEVVVVRPSSAVAAVAATEDDLLLLSRHVAAVGDGAVGVDDVDATVVAAEEDYYYYGRDARRTRMRSFLALYTGGRTGETVSSSL